jgi:hypothetical protein
MSRTKYAALTFAVLLPLLTGARVLLAQDSLKFNVPYVCPDGSTYVVHRCQTGPKGEFCFYQRDQNSERFNLRSAVAYQMNTCKLNGPAASAAPPGQGPSDLQLNTPYQCAGGLMITVFECAPQAGQVYCQVRAEMNGQFLGQVPKPRSETVAQMSACKAGTPYNPPYVAEFPSAFRVVQGMVVGDPRQNMVRSIGAFYQLSEILKVFAGQRANGGLLPDEKRLLDDYSRISSQLAQTAAQKFPGEHFDLSTNPYRFSRTDPKFGFEGIPVWVTFLSPNIQSSFARDVGGDNPQYFAAVEQQKRAAMQKLNTDIKVAQAEANYAKDPGSVAARHCLESGRSEMECLGEGLKVGTDDLMGHPLKGLVPAIPAGLRLTGLYAAGSVGLRFAQDAVDVACGVLVPQRIPYAVERSGLQITVKIPIAPRALVLSYRDGKLAGPGPIDVAGEVVIGGMTDDASTSYEMQTQTTTTQRQIGANEVPNYSLGQVHQNGMEYSVDQQTTSANWVPTTTHHYSVPTKPKTEHCNAGILPPTSETGSVSGVLTQLVGSKGSKSSNTAPGLRLNGTYAAQGGLKIEFRDDSATLECGEAFNSEAYAVLTEGGQMVVKFQNGTGPLSLVLQPNGTLAGSGNVDVAGRRAIQSDSGGLDYLPRNSRCALGILEAVK